MIPESDREKIQQLYENLAGNMEVFALSILRDQGLAQSAVQDTFLIALQKPDAVLSSPNPEGWIINTLKYVIRNTERTRNFLLRTTVSIEEMQEEPSAEDRYEEPPELLMHSGLSKEEEKMLTRFYMDGIPMKNLAAEMNITLTACKVRMMRARDKIRRSHSGDSSSG